MLWSNLLSGVQNSILKIKTRSIDSKVYAFYSVLKMSENGPNPYVMRKDESIQNKRARLLYQSRKRGMSENGLILSTFCAKYLNGFSETQLDMYDKIINMPSNDWDLYYWATGVKDTPNEFENEIMKLLKNHVKNESKESRYFQPALY